MEGKRKEMEWKEGRKKKKEINKRRKEEERKEKRKRNKGKMKGKEIVVYIKMFNRNGHRDGQYSEESHSM